MFTLSWTNKRLFFFLPVITHIIFKKYFVFDQDWISELEDFIKTDHSAHNVQKYNTQQNSEILPLFYFYPIYSPKWILWISQLYGINSWFPSKSEERKNREQSGGEVLRQKEKKEREDEMEWEKGKEKE